jgi:hypothetical protein
MKKEVKIDPTVRSRMRFVLWPDGGNNDGAQAFHPAAWPFREKHTTMLTCPASQRLLALKRDKHIHYCFFRVGSTTFKNSMISPITGDIWLDGTSLNF